MILPSTGKFVFCGCDLDISPFPQLLADCFGFFRREGHLRDGFFAIFRLEPFFAYFGISDPVFSRISGRFFFGTGGTDGKGPEKGNPRALFVSFQFFCLKTKRRREFPFLSGEPPGRRSRIRETDSPESFADGIPDGICTPTSEFPKASELESQNHGPRGLHSRRLPLNHRILQEPAKDGRFFVLLYL